MPRKHRQKRQHDAPQSQRVRRQLEKGDAKLALKEAKRCFRVDPSADHRSLLEEAFLGRVEQLHRMKQVAEAKTVLSELLQLKPTTPKVTERLARLQVMVGDGKADANAVLKDDPALLVELVDQAVLNKSACVPDFGDIRAQVAAVRDALVAVERGADEEAAERLTMISRNSPLADWRLFVRGLSAFYDQDEERMTENWKRLEASRPGFRIAETLRAAAGIRWTEQTADFSAGVRRLELHVRTDAMIDELNQFAGAWNQRDRRGVFRHYRHLQQRFSKSHQTLIQQLVDLMWKRAVRDADDDALAKLARIGPAPEIDPRWNRAKALLAEHPDSRTSVNGLESAWVAYAEDLGQMQCLRDTERPMAVGLVYQRLARELGRYAEDAAASSPFGDGYDDEDTLQVELRDAAARHYRESILSCPGLQASYLELAQLHEENDEVDKAAKTMEKLVRQDPECFEAVIWLAHYYLSQDNPGDSERHVKAAQRLRPRDPRCAVLAWNQKMTMIRRLAISRQFEAARQEIAQAAEMAPPSVEPYTLDLIRAGVEFKAKNLEAAHAQVDAAVAKVEQPTAIWVQMSGLAARMRVAREFKKEFDDRFKRDIAKTPTCESAGRMARFLAGIKVSKANYTGRATHERLLINYLRRAVTLPWNQFDLRSVCVFLEQLPRQNDLRRDFIQTGVEQFPRAPHFHYWAGMQEVARGPRFCNLEQAITCLQKAIDLNQTSDLKLPEGELENARSALSMVKDVQEQEQAFAAGSPFYLDDDEYDDDDFDDDDDDDDYAADDLPPELDDAAIAALASTMPPEIKKKMEEIARMMGVGPREAFRQLLGFMGRVGFDGDDDFRKPQAKNRKKR